MAEMFEFYLDLEGGDEGAHIHLKAPNNMSDHDLLRFLTIAMVSRRHGDRSVPFAGAEYAARLCNVSELLTGVETLVQEELRQDFGLYGAIDTATKLNFLRGGKKRTLWATIKRKALRHGPTVLFVATMFLVIGLAAPDIISAWKK